MHGFFGEGRGLLVLCPQGAEEEFMKRGSLFFLMVAFCVTALVSTGCSKSSGSSTPAANGGSTDQGADGTTGAGGAVIEQATPALNADIPPNEFAEILMAQTWCSTISGYPVSAQFYSDRTGSIYVSNDPDNPDNQNFTWKLMYAPPSAHTTYALDLAYDDGHKETLLAAYVDYEIRFYSGSRLLITWKTCTY